MSAWARFVVKRRRLLLLIAVVLMIPCVAGFLLTGVNYDVTTYLPQDLPSKQGQDILAQDFGLAANVTVMVQDRAPWQVADLQAQIAAVPGVEKAESLTSYLHPAVPLSFVPDSVKERFWAGDAAAIQVQFTDGTNAQTTQTAVERIRELAGADAAVSGLPVIIHDVMQIFAREIWVYIAVAVAVILVVLSLASTSTLEPVLLLVSVGFAVALNLGTNFFFGTTSYITRSIAAVLQLAVSMDYGIFLIHRFADERERHATAEEAMVTAVVKTSTAIGASALTTVAGFAALIVMRFGLGTDLGLVMAKGVLFSLLSTLTLLPGLLLECQGIMARFRHRSLFPSFDRISGWIVRQRAVFLAVFAVLLLPAFGLQRQVEPFYAMAEGLSPDVRAVADSERVSAAFGTDAEVYLITEDRGLAEEQRLVTRLAGIPGVASIQSLAGTAGGAVPEFYPPADVRARFRQGDYALSTIELTGQTDTGGTRRVLDQIASVAREQYDTVDLTGETALTEDLKTITDSDLSRVNTLSVLAIAAIIAIAFGSASIPVLLVLAIQFAIWVNLAGARLVGVDLYFITYLVLGAIQMGATVDYAILLTGKYKEALADHEPRQAMALAIARGGRSILASSLTLTGATLAVGALSRIRMAGQVCAMLGAGAMISMLTALFILPGLLLISDRVVGLTTLGWPRRARGRVLSGANETEGRK